FRPVSTLGTGTAVLVALAVGINVLPAGAAWPFTILCAVLGFTWLFLLPFQVALAFRADSKGRVAMLIPSAQLVGSALGPLAASAVVTEAAPHAVPLVRLLFALLAGALVSAVWRLRVDSGVEAPAAVKETG